MALTAKGQANGLATLDDDGLLEAAQLPDGFGAQGAAVTDQGALTATAPSALTSTAASGGDAPTEAEYNALRTDVSNLRTTVAAAVVDLAAARTKLNALLASLRAADLLDT
jgi:hypothetical protein